MVRIRYALAFFIISKEFDNEQHTFKSDYDNFMFEAVVYLVNRIGARVGLKDKEIVRLLIDMYKPILNKEAVDELLSKSG